MEADRLAALIPAAGGGVRLGRGPKAFVSLAGRPLLAWSVEALRPFVAEIVIAVPDADVERTAALVPAARVVAGADTRQATVERLLLATERPVVLVHDAARPFIDAAVITAVTAALETARALSVVMPVADSLIDARDGSSVDRSLLRAVQTPQAFERTLLLEAHAAARADGVSATDDAALVRRLGVHVALVEGGAHLMKVTTPADLRLAEAYARSLLVEAR